MKLNNNEMSSVLMTSLLDIAEDFDNMAIKIDNVDELDDFDVKDFEVEFAFINEKIKRLNRLVADFKTQSNPKASTYRAISDLIDEFPSLSYGNQYIYVHGKKYLLFYDGVSFMLADRDGN